MSKKENKKTKLDYKTDILTGIRPTGSLTIANFLGAVAPIIKLQKRQTSILVFVADLHALTDHEPDVVRKYSKEIVANYIALGLDPEKVNIYLQSDIAEELMYFTGLLARHISVAKLERVPTLKDKIKKGQKKENANALLLLYPVLMAADILINRSKKVPIGEDQMAHMEVTRYLAKKFNKKYGNVLPLPKALQKKSIRILSLKGKGKMSKSSPNGAIFLTDDKKTIAKKIKSAQTAFKGKMSEKLKSHILVAKNLAKNKKEKEKIDEIVKKHKNGEQVMGEFKKILTEIVQRFVSNFQSEKEKVVSDPDLIPSILENGKKIAKQNAREALKEINKALKFK